MTQRTTVRLDPALLRSAKKKAAQEGRTLTSLIEEGLRKVVVEPSIAEQKAVRDFKLPVSTAGSGNPASIDMRKTSELLDMMDDELPLVKHR